MLCVKLINIIILEIASSDQQLILLKKLNKWVLSRQNGHTFNFMKQFLHPCPTKQ